VNRATTGSHPGGLTSAAVTRPPARYLVGFQGIGSVAIKAQKRALPFAAGRQRLDHDSPAAGASRPFGFAQEVNLPPNRLVRPFQMELGGGEY
jgi:hypothetical protein